MIKRRFIVLAMALAVMAWGCDDDTGTAEQADVLEDSGEETSGETTEPCGNGVLDAGEACDPGITSGDGACPSTCDAPGDTCSEATLTGDADSCTAECVVSTISSCTNADGCCPDGCDSTNDNDCSITCGNGVTEPGEECDGDCPETCDDSAACTEDRRSGETSSCDVECSYVAIVECVDGDGCCPGGCNSGTDSDCSANCPNGIVDEGETCDGNCPALCNDGNACTIDTRAGDASTCNVVCTYESVTECTGGDGCCPAGCSTRDDSDCSVSCGNGVVESGETCDGNCPEACEDNNACTTGTLTGSAENCSAACSFEAVSACADDDDCCPAGCTTANDNDCSAVCGNEVVDDDAGETCDGDCPSDCDDSNACTNDVLTGSAANCNVICSNEAITQCADDDGCCAPGCDATNDNDCAADRVLGEACSSGGACASGACIDEPNLGWPGGYCSADCTSDDDCGDTAHCAADDDGFGVCLVDCGSDSDCRTPDYACGDLDFDGVDECIPAATGSGEPGATCETIADCGGGAEGFCISPEQGFKDGYCTVSCTASDPCPGGSHCRLDTTTGSGICVTNCGGDDDCRDGYICIDEDSDAANECWPGASGSGEVGDACEAFYDCGGRETGFCFEEGANWQDGYCSEECDSENPCPNGSHCYDPDSTGSGVCLADCGSDSDCRAAGYLCLDPDEDGTDECWPSATGSADIGDPCAATFDCQGGDDGFCFTQADGWRQGYCSQGCDSETACPGGSHCYDPDGDGSGACLSDCAGNSECRLDGYLCLDPEDDATNECLPAATGTGRIGTPCNGVWDCRGGEFGVCFTADQGAPGGYCSLLCGTDQGSCQTGSDCVDFTLESGTVFYCLDSCESLSDCRAGYRCDDFGGDSAIDECFP